MQKLVISVISTLFLLHSCAKEDIFPQVENTTSGKKWTLQIGSSPLDVYSQLQILGKEKNFDAVAIVYRKPYSKPEEIENYLGFYQAITLQSKSGVMERALIQFSQDKVSSIEVGGALPDPIATWPPNSPDEIAIHVNDPVDKVYGKLLAIYQIPTYRDYQIILPDKTLKKPFDPNMANFDEWAFDFSENISAGKVGRSFVRLFFNDKKLVKIRLEYKENEVVN
jgi:hypothetical protein